jgi:hypothetical protein
MLRYFLAPVFFITLPFLAAFAQPVITALDLSAQLTVGKTITSHTDTSTTSINIGSPGATSWDFSMLKTNFSASAMLVRPDTTPFSSSFPGSTIAERVPAGFGSTVYSYLQLGTDLLIRGTGVTGSYPERIMDSPAEMLYRLPLAMGVTWTTEYAESTYITLPPPLPPQVTVTTHSISNSVDAYGTLTLPGGGTYQALRVKTDARTTTPGHSSRSIRYSILASNGASAVVAAADTLQPDNGVIQVVNVSRTDPLLTDVPLSESVPTRFVLDQNYPNPFNPTTVVSFQLSAASEVRLVVYDLLGREVRRLVDERKPAGKYKVGFDAGNLSSGVYLYRLTAGLFVDTRRMVLMK